MEAKLEAAAMASGRGSDGGPSSCVVKGVLCCDSEWEEGEDRLRPVEPLHGDLKASQKRIAKGV